MNEWQRAAPPPVAAVVVVGRTVSVTPWHGRRYLGLKYVPGLDETAKLLTHPLNEQRCQIVLFLFP